MPNHEASIDHKGRDFYGLLVNTLIANVTTSFLWFALTFWYYLETRSVLATALLGGSYMLLVAVLGVPFGSWIDRARKKQVMTVGLNGTRSRSIRAMPFASASPPTPAFLKVSFSSGRNAL